MLTNETLVWFGGQCKALDDAGRFGGHLVLFGTAEATDASSLKDFFTPETDFAIDDVGGRSRLLYHHGLDPSLGNKKLGTGPGSIKADELGIWLEGQLDLRDKYERKIFGMVKDGKLGLSSGTAPHLIRREKQANGAHKILAWPLGLDASLTPSPAEPRTAAVALKSLLIGAIKGEYLGDRAEPAAVMAAHSSLASRLQDSVWAHVGDEKRTPADRMASIEGAHDEFKSLAMKMCKSLLMGDDANVKSDGAGDLRLFDECQATLARLHAVFAAP